MSFRARVVVFFILALVVVSFFHFSFTNIPDADSMYHIRHSWIYRTTSFFDSDFPWLQFSVIRAFGADLWYGFHVFLTPFTFFTDPILGIRVAGVFLTLVLLAGFLWVAVRHKFSMPFVWPFFLFFAVPNVLFYFLMVRPQALSLILGLLLLSFLVRRQSVFIFFISLGITFLHTNYFWLAPVIAGTFVFIRFAAYYFGGKNKKFSADWKPLFLVFGSTIIGLMLRPAPLANLRLVKVIGEIIIQRLNNMPLTFGLELYPLSVPDLFRTTHLFLALWVVAMGLFIRFVWISRKTNDNDNTQVSEKIFVGGCSLLSAAFLLMALMVAMRFFIGWVVFGTIVIAYAYSKLLPLAISYNLRAWFMVAVFMFMVPYAVYRHSLNEKYVAVPPDKFEAEAKWLAGNTSPRDIVFNLHWDNFGPLFLYNQNNYYIGGLDPMFQYVYEPSLYWKFHYLSVDKGGKYTCRAFPCTKPDIVDTYSALVDDFQAKYVFIEPARNPNFLEYVMQDERYEQVFGARDALIFKIK